MDRILQPAISIQIILPEDICGANSNEKPTVRHSGDEIRGHLEVTTRGNFEFEVNLSFEGQSIFSRLTSVVIEFGLGLVRTWVGFQNDSDPYRLPPTAEFQLKVFAREPEIVFRSVDQKHQRPIIHISTAISIRRASPAHLRSFRCPTRLPQVVSFDRTRELYDVYVSAGNSYYAPYTSSSTSSNGGLHTRIQAFYDEMYKAAQMDAITWNPKIVSCRAFTSKCLVFGFWSINYCNLKPCFYTKLSLWF
ncbi:hypothetical protein D0Z07_7432 [Hyphodiscus hymeniophilus]|uniref:Uncharacterized protein n=1 Tax=Hyphodiscus hymeniophilus TaxID=353542 RepID=A0A9P7AU74_9HELO|nr:hypothetical protein D0Z07_7432 [Hyphodiscus hymeniophilus]